MCLSVAKDGCEVVSPSQLRDKRLGIIKIKPGESQVVLFMKNSKLGSENFTIPKKILPVHLDREELVARCEKVKD